MHYLALGILAPGASSVTVQCEDTGFNPKYCENKTLFQGWAIRSQKEEQEEEEEGEEGEEPQHTSVIAGNSGQLLGGFQSTKNQLFLPVCSPVSDITLATAVNRSLEGPGDRVKGLIQVKSATQAPDPEEPGVWTETAAIAQPEQPQEAQGSCEQGARSKQNFWWRGPQSLWREHVLSHASKPLLRAAGEDTAWKKPTATSLACPLPGTSGQPWPQGPLPCVRRNRGCAWQTASRVAGAPALLKARQA
ncbi:PREDICTED: uncharacterized protein LOC102025471 [Chinchilla lanigera]|uniref:uncharacterized protein LOC102025471 n=1 Tax=Chinchilla lanigera TaxID=34839 RepID=UPI000698E7EE|nr:PREDICTED: uncharacterized protein LOC102025471 [Chinchilla lanigera]